MSPGRRLPVRVGIIGAGRVAGLHVQALERLPDVLISAVVDPRREAADTLAARVGARAYSRVEDALADAELDAVDIITPPATHAGLAITALEAGLHVFVDKPLATTVADAERLCDVARWRQDLTLSVCHNLLFHPALRRTQELLADGLLGEPTRAQAWSTGWLDLAPWDFRRDAAASGGGAWADGAPHLIYVTEALLGPITGIHALRRVASRLDGEDTAVAIAGTRSGAVATYAIGYSDCPHGPSSDWPQGWQLGISITGSAGWATVTFLPTSSVVWQRRAEAATEEVFPPDSFQAGFDGALRDFVTAVTTGAPLRVTAEHSLRNLTLVAAALREDGHAGVARS